jgi:hypothetical protein
MTEFLADFLAVLSECKPDISSETRICIVNHYPVLFACHLLQDPSFGRVMLDGCDLRDLNLKWLRTHVRFFLGKHGVVCSQTLSIVWMAVGGCGSLA